MERLLKQCDRMDMVPKILISKHSVRTLVFPVYFWCTICLSCLSTGQTWAAVSSQLYPTLWMVWSVFLQILSGINIDDNQCCVEDLMESEANFSVSLIGFTVYISWGLFSSSSIRIAFLSRPYTVTKVFDQC